MVKSISVSDSYIARKGQKRIFLAVHNTSCDNNSTLVKVFRTTQSMSRETRGRNEPLVASYGLQSHCGKENPTKGMTKNWGYSVCTRFGTSLEIVDSSNSISSPRAMDKGFPV